MKISELPKEIREKALEYQKNETSTHRSKITDDLFYAFDWHKTTEGSCYWIDVATGEIPEGDDYWEGVYDVEIPQQPIRLPKK